MKSLLKTINYKPLSLRICIGLFLYILGLQSIYAQSVGIGASYFTPNTKSMLEVQGTGKGLLIPRMTNANRPASPHAAEIGMLIFQTDDQAGFPHGFYYWDSTLTVTKNWYPFLSTAASAIGGWMTTGNSATVASTNFIGTIDSIDFVTRTNSVERMRVTGHGLVGIGTASPSKGRLSIVDVGTGYDSTALYISSTGSSNATFGYGAFIEKSGAKTSNYGIWVKSSGSTGKGGGIRSDITEGGANSAAIFANNTCTTAGSQFGLNALSNGASTLGFGIRAEVKTGTNGTSAIFATNTSTGNSAAGGSYYGVQASVTSATGTGVSNSIGVGGSTTSTGTGKNYGVNFNSTGGVAENYGALLATTGTGTTGNWGVNAQATGTGATNYGLETKASGGTTVNYGVKSTAVGSNTGSNIGGYFLAQSSSTANIGLQVDSADLLLGNFTLGHMSSSSPITIVMKNGSGAAVNEGDIVIASGTADNFTTPGAGTASNLIIGVVYGTGASIANGAYGRIAIAGIAKCKTGGGTGATAGQFATSGGTATAGRGLSTAAFAAGTILGYWLSSPGTNTLGNIFICRM